MNIHDMKLMWNFPIFGDIFSEPLNQNDTAREFQPVHNEKVHYLHISNDGLKTDGQPRREAIQLWRKIEQKAIKTTNKITNKDEL